MIGTDIGSKQRGRRSVSSRPARAGSLCRVALPFVLAIGLAAGHAAANEVVKLELKTVDGPVVRVVSNAGKRWDRLEPGSNPATKLLLEYECRFKHKLFGFKPSVEGSVFVSGPLEGSWKDDNLKPGEDAVIVKVPLKADGSYGPVKMCNDRLGSRVIETGKPKEYFLARGLTLKTTTKVEARGTVMCPAATKAGFDDFESTKTFVPVTVKCVSYKYPGTGKGKPAPSGGGTPSPPSPKPKKVQLVDFVQKVETTLDPAVYKGRCPARFRVAGKVKVAWPGKIRYRYVNQRGERSNVVTRTFDKAGTYELPSWTHQPKKPVKSKLAANPGQANVDQGWYQLEIVEPRRIKGRKASYRNECGKVGGPATIRAVPKPKTRPKAGPTTRPPKERDPR